MNQIQVMILLVATFITSAVFASNEIYCVGTTADKSIAVAASINTKKKTAFLLTSVDSSQTSYLRAQSPETSTMIGVYALDNSVRLALEVSRDQKTADFVGAKGADIILSLKLVCVDESIL